MRRTCIAVFAKTPGLSPVKTRLAKTVGADKAEEIYTHCITSIEQTLTQMQGVDICWALAEQEAPAHGFWRDKPFQKMWTGEGDLGDRLHHVYSTLKQDYDFVLVMGTDSPQISAHILMQALQKEGTVIGPAHDGGYYLFGCDSDINQTVWKAVPYSAENTREIFLDKLAIDVHALITLSDLDVIDDADKIISEMPEDKNQAQVNLIECLQKL